MPLFAWLLNGIYGCLLLLIAPVIVYRMITQGKYRDGWAQKLWGQLPEREDSSRPAIWWHAVSVGEVLLLQPLLKEWQREHSNYDIVITTTTITGYNVAHEKFPEHHICYFPLDFSWAVHRAIQRIRPSMIALVELELWPNFIFAASKANIPLALVNGRISEKSFKGYRRIRPLMRKLLHCFDCCIMQNETYASRIADLGAAKESIHISGSIKFDHLETNRKNSRTEELRVCFRLEAEVPVFIAGSTQAPEEAIALNVWKRLVEEFPHLRLILVPRHQERFEEVAQLVLQQGVRLLRRSSETQPAAQLDKASECSLPEVCLLDTLGELNACWGLADFAFVGGSLTQRGGQNMIEPSAYGAAVMFGPNTWNFRDVVQLLLENQAAIVVADEEQLYATLRQFLKNPNQATQLGEIAHQLMFKQQGATNATVNLLHQLVDIPAIININQQSAA